MEPRVLITPQFDFVPLMKYAVISPVEADHYVLISWWALVELPEHGIGWYNEGVSELYSAEDVAEEPFIQFYNIAINDITIDLSDQGWHIIIILAPFTLGAIAPMRINLC